MKTWKKCTIPPIRTGDGGFIFLIKNRQTTLTWKFSSMFPWGKTMHAMKKNIWITYLFCPKNWVKCIVICKVRSQTALLTNRLYKETYLVRIKFETNIYTLSSSHSMDNVHRPKILNLEFLLASKLIVFIIY